MQCSTNLQSFLCHLMLKLDDHKVQGVTALAALLKPFLALLTCRPAVLRQAGVAVLPWHGNQLANHACVCVCVCHTLCDIAGRQKLVEEEVGLRVGDSSWQSSGAVCSPT